MKEALRGTVVSRAKVTPTSSSPRWKRGRVGGWGLARRDRDCEDQAKRCSEESTEQCTDGNGEDEEEGGDGSRGR